MVQTIFLTVKMYAGAGIGLNAMDHAGAIVCAAKDRFGI